MHDIGKKLAELRKQNQLKQTDLAEKLNVSQQVISNIERGFSAPDIDFLLAAADLYRVSLDDLIGRNFVGEDTGGYERRVLEYIKQMNDKEKELSIGLLSQVAQHRGNENVD